MFLHDWRNSYGEHGAQGVYLSPEGERTVEVSWFIDGRDNEGALRRPRVVRKARNEALARVRVALSSAGWNTYVKTSTNTQTRRDLSIVASRPL